MWEELKKLEFEYNNANFFKEKKRLEDLIKMLGDEIEFYEVTDNSIETERVRLNGIY